MVAPLNSNLSLGRSILQTRDTLADLQRQLASGKKHTSYAALGLERSKILSLRTELSQIQAYAKSNGQVDIRLDVMAASLTRIRELAADTRANALEVGFDLQPSGQTVYQMEAASRLDEVVTLLNTNVGDRYLFAGRDTEGAPVLTAPRILDGYGTQAGFRQIAAERRQADMGADGRGRLIIPSATGGAVSIAEDAAGSPFGLKLTGVVTTLAGTTAVGPAGSPAGIDITFSATLPEDGQTLRLSLLLPDGTETEITLTARAAAQAGAGEFTIGADAASTAINFQSALAAAIEGEAQTTLSAASLFAAANDFFDFDDTAPPQRVDGPPFDSATGLRDATATDTVFWYAGELSSTSARQSAIAKADDTVLVSYGARANEEGLTTVIKQLAALAVEIFQHDDPQAPDRYREIKGRAIAALSFNEGAQSPDSILTELVSAKTTLGRATSRHQANHILLRGFVDDAENTDVYELSGQILSLQNRLEASLQVSVALRRLSLVNYI